MEKKNPNKSRVVKRIIGARDGIHTERSPTSIVIISPSAKTLVAKTGLLGGNMAIYMNPRADPQKSIPSSKPKLALFLPKNDAEKPNS